MKEVLSEKYQTLVKKYGFESSVNAHDINRIIRESLTCFMDENENVAIYGYGVHTEMLMADFIFELKKVKYIVENYCSSTEGSGFHIISDKELEAANIDAVIVSSYKFKDEIIENLKKNHPQIKYLDIYEEIEKHDIVLKGDYYYQNHPYHHYRTINGMQRKLNESELQNEKKECCKKLIGEFIQIKDFRTALIYAGKLLEESSEEIYRQLETDIRELYDLEKLAAERIEANNVVLLCMDGLRRQDLSDKFMPKLQEICREQAFSYSNAYSFSTSTYESLVPVFSGNSDLRTRYYESTTVPEENCRFMQEAEKQGRNIYFYTDMVEYITSGNILRSASCQTATEKMWNFILDAAAEKNGLFYLHISYESHFSFSNPYTKEKLISEGTALMFDYLNKKGGKLRTDYVRQHRDAISYLDDVLSPFVKRLDCRMLLFADHGNLLIEKGNLLKDLEETKYTFHEDLIQIPVVIKSPETGKGTSNKLLSLMSLNDIVISLLGNEKYVEDNNKFIKLARSEIYNPDFIFLYRQYGHEHGLLAFELFIFEEGYKLAVFSDGQVELFRTEDDSKIDSYDCKQKLYAQIKDFITVCETNDINL